MIDIGWLLPEKIIIQVWKNKYETDLVDNKYVLQSQLDEYTETDKVFVYVGDKLFDTIDKYISLRAWDTLHLEYSIDVIE